MATIYKYALQMGRTALMLPKGAQVLTAQVQNGVLQMWVKVNPEAPEEARVFETYGTGHDMPDDPRLIYVATFQMLGGSLVFHVFEVPAT